MSLRSWLSSSLQLIFGQSGCGVPSVWIASLSATKKNVAEKPCLSRIGTACSNWQRSPSSNVREIIAGRSIVLVRSGQYRIQTPQYRFFPLLLWAVERVRFKVYEYQGC